MTTDPLDYAHAIVAKSDQLNASDLPFPTTVRITGATVSRTGSQDVTYRISGGFQPWKPCKGMLALMAKVSGTTSAAPWVGMYLTLFCDPATSGRVFWAGKPADGIRIAAIDSRMLRSRETFRVRIGKVQHAEYVVEPLSAPSERETPKGDLDAILAEAGLTLPDVDRWREAKGSGPISGLTDEQRAVFAGWLGADPRRLDAIRTSGEQVGGEE